MKRKYVVGTRLVLELGETVQDAVIKVISTKKSLVLRETARRHIDQGFQRHNHADNASSMTGDLVHRDPAQHHVDLTTQNDPELSCSL